MGSVDRNSTTEFFAAIRAGNDQAVEKMLEREPALVDSRDDQGLTAVLVAKYHGREDVAQALSERTAQLDVFSAAAVGSREHLDSLLAAYPGMAEAYSADGWTALHLAAFFGSLEAVDSLLRRGSDVHAWSTNAMHNQPLHAAVANKRVEIARRLLDAGAEIDVAEHGGFTPLHEAAHNGDLEAVRLLVSRGADPSRKTDDGKTAWDLAMKQGHRTVADLLSTATETTL